MRWHATTYNVFFIGDQGDSPVYYIPSSDISSSQTEMGFTVSLISKKLIIGTLNSTMTFTPMIASELSGLALTCYDSNIVSTRACSGPKSPIKTYNYMQSLCIYL